MYRSDTHQYQQACEIEFRPEGNVETHLLPRPVQKLAIFLQRSVGPNYSSAGSFNKVFQSSLAQTWANAAVRPWAIKGHTYCSRQQVDENLRGWSHGGPDTHALFRAIQAQLPLDERALAVYYRTTFKMNRNKATSTARTWIDLAYRSHFLFPGCT